MEYLVLDRVRERAVECRTELEALFAGKALARKPRTRQWRFFCDAAERLFAETSQPEFENLPSGPAAQLKFEVEDRMRRFYLSSPWQKWWVRKNGNWLEFPPPASH